VFGFGGVEADEFFGFENRGLFAEIEGEEAEGQFVEDDFDAGQSKGRAPLLVDEDGAVAERFEDGGERRGVRDFGLLFALALDGRARGVALLRRRRSTRRDGSRFGPV
jgi:hypothetical protein